LANTNTNSTASFGTTGSGDVVVYWGHRVWKRSSAGVETEITSGTPVAQVQKNVGAPISIDELSATWACPLTSLASTDAIVDRIYIKFGTGAWNLLMESITEQLGAQSLDAATWTFYVWVQRQYISAAGVTRGTFYFGSNTYNSRITNFTWTPAVVAIASKRLLVGVGL
jgi:hypothetical protein